MLFNSFIFLIFLGIVIPAYFFLPRYLKKWLLLVSSYFFYGYWDYRFLSLLLISTIIDFFVAKKLEQTIEQKKRKQLLLVSIIANIGILGFFKYFNFFIGSFDAITNLFGVQLDYLHVSIILPVGISFYTFQTLSYTIDVYRRKMHATNSIMDFSIFVAFFPQLVAGPIERASKLLPQIAQLPKPKREQFEKGVVLIVMGLFMKVMIGDTTGRFVDHIFTEPSSYKSIELLSALILFAIQIYADFAGYSHIARGTAKLMGFELMKNFEQPYLSQNITEFWRRWHISLSSWLKDYLYISLGGNQKGERRTYVNLMVTMLLGGLWHGASWNFVIWGGLHGLYLAVHKKILGGRKIAEHFVYTGWKSLIRYGSNVLLTFILVLITWLFFRATDWSTTKIFINKMIFWESSEFSYRFIKIIFVFLFIIILFDFFQYYTKKHSFFLSIKNAGIRYGILSAMFLVTMLYMFQADPLPFVYFQF